jgi:hypothetical protein
VSSGGICVQRVRYRWGVRALWATRIQRVFSGDRRNRSDRGGVVVGVLWCQCRVVRSTGWGKITRTPKTTPCPDPGRRTRSRLYRSHGWKIQDRRGLSDTRRREPSITTSPEPTSTPPQLLDIDIAQSGTVAPLSVDLLHLVPADGTVPADCSGGVPIAEVFVQFGSLLDLSVLMLDPGVSPSEEVHHYGPK